MGEAIHRTGQETGGPNGRGYLDLDPLGLVGNVGRMLDKEVVPVAHHHRQMVATEEVMMTVVTGEMTAIQVAEYRTSARVVLAWGTASEHSRKP